jgi:hypothetical protein
LVGGEFGTDPEPLVAGVVGAGVGVGVGVPPPEVPLGGAELPPLGGGVLLDGGGVLLAGGDVLEGGGVLGGGLELGGGAGTLSSWHCQTTGELVTVPPTPPAGSLTVAARLGGAPAALAARAAVTVRNVPPVMRPIAAGRTRAKHM